MRYLSSNHRGRRLRSRHFRRQAAGAQRQAPLILFLLAALVLVVVGCSSSEESAAPSAQPVATIPSLAVQAAPTATPPPTVAPPPSPTSAPPTAVVDSRERGNDGSPATAADTGQYPDAPELRETGEWINSEPFTLAGMQDENKVVLIDFWTYTCINCIRTLPYLRVWHDKYAEHGLVILGVHTPEFEFEKDYDNVVEAVGKFALEYPVVQDNDFGVWRSFNNRYWPAKYLIDHEGKIRYAHFGEGKYDETELKIREILTEAGYDVGEITSDTNPGPPVAQAAMEATSAAEGQTRELYAGYERNYGTLLSGSAPPYVLHEEYYMAPDAEVMYTDPGEHRNHFLYLQGLWLNTAESLVHARETKNLEDYVAFKFVGTSVNAVMSPGEDSAYEVVVYLDDAPVPEDKAGKDIMYDPDGSSYVQVDESRMYFLVDQPEFASGELRLASNSPDFSLFAFTFGSYEGGEPARES